VNPGWKWAEERAFCELLLQLAFGCWPGFGGGLDVYTLAIPVAVSSACDVVSAVEIVPNVPMGVRGLATGHPHRQPGGLGLRCLYKSFAMKLVLYVHPSSLEEPQVALDLALIRWHPLWRLRSRRPIQTDCGERDAGLLPPGFGRVPGARG